MKHFNLEFIGAALLSLSLAACGAPQEPPACADGGPGAWKEAGFSHTVGISTIRLSDGRVLRLGVGWYGGGASEIWDPATSDLQSVEDMIEPRTSPEIVVLADGRVLAVGGVLVTDHSEPIHTAEIRGLDGKWTSTAPTLALTIVRRIRLLSDGRVFAIGWTNTDLDVPPSVEIFDPVKETWSAMGSGPFAFNMREVVLLADGRVLVTGFTENDPPPKVPQDEMIAPTYNVALFIDPSTGAWSQAPEELADGQVTQLPDGRLFVLWGSEAFLFDLAAGVRQTVAPPPIPQGFHVQALLSDGRVLAGGSGIDDFDLPPDVRQVLYRGAEIFDPESTLWSCAATMLVGRYYGGESIPLLDGRVLVVGGTVDTKAIAEVFDPSE